MGYCSRSKSLRRPPSSLPVGSGLRLEVMFFMVCVIARGEELEIKAKRVLFYFSRGEDAVGCIGAGSEELRREEVQ